MKPVSIEKYNGYIYTRYIVYILGMQIDFVFKNSTLRKIIRVN